MRMKYPKAPTTIAAAAAVAVVAALAAAVGRRLEAQEPIGATGPAQPLQALARRAPALEAAAEVAIAVRAPPSPMPQHKR